MLQHPQLSIIRTQLGDATDLGSVVAVATELGYKFKPVQEVRGRNPDKGFGRLFFAVMPGSDRGTGELYALAAASNALFPRHRHRPSGDPKISAEEGEIIAGAMWDTMDNGKDRRLEAGEIFMHGDDTVHAPSAGFVIVVFHQRRGSDPVEEAAPPAAAPAAPAKPLAAPIPARHRTPK